MEMGGGGGIAMATPPSSPSGMPAMMSHKGGGMMHMTFFWGKRVQVLFTGWPGDAGVGMYLLSLLFVLAISAFVELLSAASRRVPTRSNGRVSTGLLLTTLHALRIGVAYVVMLAVMSFNVGVLLAAIAGHALGFLVASSGLLVKWPNNEFHEPAKC